MFGRHIDGHHKLIRWRFVIHGGIDGFSRSVVYLRCSTNNRADTVLNLFTNATNRYGIPSRVRSDLGTENYNVGRFIIEQRGMNRGSMITGRSVHNQRIERLWRDVRQTVVRHFASVFRFLEEEQILDPLNDYHVCVLHYIFLPRINIALEEFVIDWNNHPISTEGNRSPNQLWHSGMRSLLYSNHTAMSQNDMDWTDYGVDDEGPLPPVNADNHVYIPPLQTILSDQHLEHLESRVAPLMDDENDGCDLYVEALQLLAEM
jgi:hypothetical protein